MTSYCVDTSALVKRYVNETGSTWLRVLLDPSLSPLIVVSHLTVAEMRSALSRRLRDRILSPAEYAQLLNAFRNDGQTQYQFFPLNQAVIETASDLIERHALRTLDALQLATALLTRQFLIARGLPDVMFVSADDRLLIAAAAEGLAADNPNHHL